MIKQYPLITLSPVKKDMLPMLEQRLEDMRKQLLERQENLQPTIFEKVSTLHYGRWFILSRDSFRDEPAVPVGIRLVLSTNYDGIGDNPLDHHLTELVTEMTTDIDHLYECCEDYPEPAARTTESRMNYLKKGIIKTSAFYNGGPGRSVGQVHQEEALHNYIWEYINKNKWDDKTPAVDIHKAIRKEIDSRPEFEWSKQKAAVQGIRWFRVITYGILFIIALPVIILWVIYMFFFHEIWDKKVTTSLSQLDDKKINKLTEVEDLFPQNQFTQVAVLKPGFARRLNFKIWMLRTRVLANNVFVKGKLLNIPTIHFARWVLIDKNRHVLFFSNFDGNWEQYLGDFIDQSGWGLTAIFSNTVKFPKTHFMGVLGIVPGMPLTFPGTKFVLTGGAYDEEHFLYWSRSTQAPTHVWYCPYRHLSIKNINNNTKIRNELHENLNEEQAKIFLKRI